MASNLQLLRIFSFIYCEIHSFAIKQKKSKHTDFLKLFRIVILLIRCLNCKKAVIYVTCNWKIYISHLYVPINWIFWKVVLKFAYTNVSLTFFLLIVLWITNWCTKQTSTGSNCEFTDQPFPLERKRKKGTPLKPDPLIGFGLFEDLIFGIERKCGSHHARSTLETF